jgi:hypothetical protein
MLDAGDTVQQKSEHRQHTGHTNEGRKKIQGRYGMGKKNVTHVVTIDQYK